MPSERRVYVLTRNDGGGSDVRTPSIGRSGVQYNNRDSVKRKTRGPVTGGGVAEAAIPLRWRDRAAHERARQAGCQL